MSEKQDVTKVRVYPSRMLEVSGGDADEIALIASKIIGGLFNHGTQPSAGPPELPFQNGATVAIEAKPFPKMIGDLGPFYDVTVTQSHPAIRALERHILNQPEGSKFTMKWMRGFVGEHITGEPRECKTRSVGTLMRRLIESGIVMPLAHNEWQKSRKITK